MDHPALDTADLVPAAAADPAAAAVTTWYLEQAAPDELRPAAVPEPAAGITVMRAVTPSGEFLRYLYTSVGSDVSWVDRLPWPLDQWQARMERPGCEVWVGYQHGTPAGFIELAAAGDPSGDPVSDTVDGATGADAAGIGAGTTVGDATARGGANGPREPLDRAAVEIAYFGLLPAFRGRGIGGHLLSYGTARAWDLAERWPGRPVTSRVWLHTCSLDGPYALANYRRRGFRVTNATVSHSAG